MNSDFFQIGVHVAPEDGQLKKTWVVFRKISGLATKVWIRNDWVCSEILFGAKRRS